MMSQFHKFALIIMMSMAFLLTVSTTHALDFEVTNCDFTGVGSINEALDMVIADGGGIITYTLPCTTIFTNQIVLDTNINETPVTIFANGFEVIYDGNNAVRHFNISGYIRLTFDGITFRNGNTAAYAIGDTHGGSIRAGGYIIIRNSIFIENYADYAGGAIINGGIMDIFNTQFINNYGYNGGGAVFNEFGTLTIYDSYFEGNHSGAVGSLSDLYIINSTFTNNWSDVSVAPIFASGLLVVDGVVFSDNRSIDPVASIENINAPDTTQAGTVTYAIFTPHLIASNTDFINGGCKSPTITNNGGNRAYNAPYCPGELLSEIPSVNASAPTLTGCELDTQDGVELVGAPDATYCRVLMRDGGVVSYAGAIPTDLIGLGVKLAVDVYAIQNQQVVNDFGTYARICLDGVGRLFYLDARNMPRYPIELESETIANLTCGWIPASGTLVLVNP
jgi:hypothetical protein